VARHSACDHNLRTRSSRARRIVSKFGPSTVGENVMFTRSHGALARRHCLTVQVPHDPRRYTRCEAVGLRPNGRTAWQ
jgi:hypothetical protein